MLNTIGKSLSSSGDAECDKKHLAAPQMCELKEFGSRVNKFGVNFAVCDVNGPLLLLCEGGIFESSSEQLMEYGRKALSQSGERTCVGKESQVCRFGEANRILAAVLTLGPGVAALIDLGENSYPVDSESSSVNRNSPGEPAATDHEQREAIFSEMLSLLVEKFQAAAKVEEQIDMVSTELAQVYEELVLLHKLSTNMKVTESNANFLQMACDSLTDIVGVEGIAILLEKTIDDENQLVLAAGSGLIDINEHMAAVFKNRLEEEINGGKEALLDSEVDSPFKYDWPESIGNIIAVPLYGRDRTGTHFAEGAENDNLITGLMVAINRADKPDFDSTDVKLFNSVASRCAVFIENGTLFKDLKELFIGSLKALTSSIDAKDPYTRGHSERVAFISRWIAERIAAEESLKEEQVHRIYLAGLLHDVGKMGINEAVLRKEGKLTKQEIEHIRTHPSIGAGILSEIKQMRDIVPGVLSHHERVDGRGYPNGLAGGEIPLIGKIVGLADCFDAMTSKRVYRDALTVEQALVEIEEGLGTQFDEKVGRVFINSNVYQLWDIMQDGSPEVYGSGSFLEYGTVAVGTLIK